DVGDVAHEGDLEPTGAEMPHQDVVDDVTARVPDVRVVVDRRSADVDPGFAGFSRLEGSLFLREGVVEAHRGSRESTRRCSEVNARGAFGPGVPGSGRSQPSHAATFPDHVLRDAALGL